MSQLLVFADALPSVGLSKHSLVGALLGGLEGNRAFVSVVAHFDEDCFSIFVFVVVFEDCSFDGELEGVPPPIDAEFEVFHFEGEVDVAVVENVALVQDILVELDGEVA